MGLWIAQPRLKSNETLLISAVANLLTPRRVVGGAVAVTSKRLIFTPNRLDTLFRSRPKAVDRADITDVAVLPGGAKAASQRGVGALVHPQLEVKTRTGQWLLSVREPERLKAILQDETV
jgi:hypothetical protein